MKIDLDERLLKFSVSTILFLRTLPNNDEFFDHKKAANKIINFGWSKL